MTFDIDNTCLTWTLHLQEKIVVPIKQQKTVTPYNMCCKQIV